MRSQGKKSEVLFIVAKLHGDSGQYRATDGPFQRKPTERWEGSLNGMDHKCHMCHLVETLHCVFDLFLRSVMCLYL